MQAFTRTIDLIGQENFNKIKEAKLALFGLGGVGSYAFEALVRAGVGSMLIVDKDTIDESNINRQLLALRSTIGMAKVEVAKQRAYDINSSIKIIGKQICLDRQNIDSLELENYDYIVDAIDMVTAKILLIERAKELNIPIITSLGTGNKVYNTGFKIVDISETRVCPLAKVIRTELKKRNIGGVKALYSEEEPLTRLRPPASISYVPPTAGYMIAGQVIRDIIGF